MIDWEALSFDETQLGDAVCALAATAGLAAASRPPPSASSEPGAHGSIEALAEAIGLDALPVALTYATLRASLSRLAPAIVALTFDDCARPTRRYLALLRSSPREVTVLTPLLGQAKLQVGALEQRVARALVRQPAEVVGTWLEQARIARRRRARAEARLLALLLADRPIEGAWILRRDPGDRFDRLLAASGVVRSASRFLVAAAAQVALATAAYWLLGREMLRGTFEHGWREAFALLAATAVPLQVATIWLGGRIGVGLATVLKQRLLCGALRLPPASIRSKGSGGLLAMVSESEAVERAGLDGTVAASVALLQVSAAGALLRLGAGGVLHLALLLGYTALLAALALRTRRRLTAWTAERFGLSRLFVEQVQGHRTRAVQGDPARYHEAEDARLERYAETSRALDRSSDLLAVLPARGWLALGIIGLVPALLGSASQESVALSLLGVLQAQQAFATLGQSLGSLLTAAVAWRSVRPLFDAAASVEERGALPELPAAHGASSPERGSTEAPRPVMELRGVSFRHANTGRFALRDCSLTLRSGERWLLEGASGSGKSTLASVMSGIYRPSTGLVLLHGLDRATVGGATWRRRIAMAPQFHENHLLSAPLSFNLLMGRAWPPSDADLAEAHETCRALGLAPLLARMPSGIHQIIGETGWQLSHGERSRVFLARALLQHSAVVVLDESFGALDPDTLEVCMEAVRARAPTLMVIAHP